MRFIILIAVLTVYIEAYSQGCSDAGFCTMGAMKPDQPFNRNIKIKLRSMEVSFYRGTTTTTPVVYVTTMDFNFSINSLSSFQIKVPYTFVRQGNLGKTDGLSDLSLCYTRSLKSTDKFDLNFSAGAKIPTNKSDLLSDKFPGEPLPMYYQTSLGTFDFISGVSLINRKWLFATGIQIPLIHNNENTFDWTDFPEYPSQEYLETYSQSNLLKRGIDVMLRVERNFRFSRLNFSAGLLPIYRITNDRITDMNGAQVKPDGAKGLAMSGIITGGYQFNVKNGIKLLWGHKIVQREKNPDGLTREMVTSLTYNYRF
jgi:hypothetical protein